LITNNDIKKRDKNLCELYKILALANSYLKGIMIEKGIINLDNNKDTYNIIRAIKRIQTKIIN